MSENAKKLATFEDLLKVPEDERAELVDGEIIRNAMPTPRHSSAQANIAMELSRYKKRPDEKDPGGWFILTEASVKYDARNAFHHDLAGWRLDRKPDLEEAWIKTVPDWVCEILSKSTSQVDRVRKYRTLMTHKVPYYWLVDLKKRTLLVFVFEDGTYILEGNYGLDERCPVPPFMDYDLDISRIVNAED